MIYWITKTLNNREISVILWVVFAVILSLFKNEFRQSYLELLKALVNKWLLIAFMAMILYISLAIWGVSFIGLWNSSLLKDTVIWTFGVAFIMIMNSKKALRNKNYFKAIIHDNFRLLLIITFIINLYVFNLITEIVLVPITVFLGIFQAYVEYENKYKSIRHIVNSFIALLTIIYLIITIVNIIIDIDSFMTIDNLRSFLFPIALTVIFIPFAYLFVVLSCTRPSLFD